MEFKREGTSNSKPPLLDGSGNYPYWKVRMIAFLRLIDYDVWKILENGYTPPTMVVEGKKKFPNPRLIGPKEIGTRPTGIIKPLMPYTMVFHTQNFVEFSLVKLRKRHGTENRA